MSDEFLQHHGILGQKWGVRRYQNADGSLTPEGYERYSKSKRTNYIEDGGTIKKGKTLYRIGADKGDPTVLNRKYFSTNRQDHKLWKDALWQQNMQYGGSSDLKYKAVKDLKISSNTQAGKKFIDYLNNANDETMEVIAKDIRKAMSYYPLKVSSTDSLEARFGNFSTATIAAQTKTGEAFVNYMLEHGYDGVGDINGTDISKDPIIIFNPDKNTKLVKENYVGR